MFKDGCLCLLGSDAFCFCLAGQVRYHRGGQADHVSFGIGDDFHSTAQHDLIGMGLLEDIVMVAERVMKLFPGFEVKMGISAHQGPHGIEHYLRILRAGHLVFGAGAAHEGDVPFFQLNLYGSAVQVLQVLNGQLMISGKIFGENCCRY